MQLQNIILITVALFAGIIPEVVYAKNAPATSWDGHYTYTDMPDVPPNSPGSEQIVTYELAIDHPKPSDCILTAEGFQTDEQIICTISGNPEQATIAFKNFGNGQIENEYGVAVYKVGVPLFILKRQGKKIEVIWRQLEPNIHKPGHYYIDQEK